MSSFSFITPLHLSCSSQYRWPAHVLLLLTVHTHDNHISIILPGHPLLHLTISLTLAPTLPSAKLSFLGHIFIYTYSSPLSGSPNVIISFVVPVCVHYSNYGKNNRASPKVWCCRTVLEI